MASMSWEVVCGKCGSELNCTPVIKRGDELVVSAEPCETCMEKATDAAREEGETAGRIDGRAEAKREFSQSEEDESPGAKE